LSSFFSLPLFRFFDLTFSCIFSLFICFYHPLFSPSFLLLFCTCFFAHMVSSLAYPTCLGIKGLDVVVVSVMGLAILEKFGINLR
jgi:hypothetical protein